MPSILSGCSRRSQSDRAGRRRARRTRSMPKPKQFLGRARRRGRRATPPGARCRRTASSTDEDRRYALRYNRHAIGRLAKRNLSPTRAPQQIVAGQYGIRDPSVSGRSAIAWTISSRVGGSSAWCFGSPRTSPVPRLSPRHPRSMIPRRHRDRKGERTLPRYVRSPCAGSPIT